MKIVVCIKQVPDTTDIKWTENNTIRREGLESIINPFDVFAVENSLQLKEKNADTKITAISMGPYQAESMLRKVLSLGIDDAILLCDKKFAGSDTYATAKTIATAIAKRIDNFDLIICGQFATDGDTAQTGPSIANFLNIPQITFVKKITEVSKNSVTVLRETDDGEETVRVELPALICILKGDYEPQRAKINGIKRAYKKQILIQNAEDMGINPDSTGIKGSPTYVSRAFRAPKRNTECIYIENIENLAGVINTCKGVSND